MKHTHSTECLKLIRVLDNENNENNELLNKMIEFQKSHLENKPKKKNEVAGFFINSNKIFKEGIFIGHNLEFIFDTNMMIRLSEKFDFLFK